MRMGNWALAAAVLGGLVGCGEETLEDLLGDVRASVTGSVLAGAEAPHVGIIFPRLDGEVAGPDYYGAAAPVDEHGGFALELGGPPNAGAIAEYGDSGLTMALGFVWAFDDLNRDGTFAEARDGSIAPDLMLGIATGNLLVYVAQVGDADTNAQIFVNPEALTIGYHLVEGVCGAGENGLDKLRILPRDAEPTLEVVAAEDEEVELRCLLVPWPGEEG